LGVQIRVFVAYSLVWEWGSVQNKKETRENAKVDGLIHQIPVTQLTKKRHLSIIPVSYLKSIYI